MALPVDTFLSRLSEEALRQILARACEASDWNDPEMDIYNDYDNAKQ